MRWGRWRRLPGPGGGGPLAAANQRRGCRDQPQHRGARGASAARHCRHEKAGNVLTHCNAGWLATVDWGTATSPIYQAHDAGVPVHVFVDETRPRNQGAQLTAWELGKHGVPHSLIVDNAGGHLMQHGEVDVVIVGTDRRRRGAMWRTRSAPT